MKLPNWIKKQDFDELGIGEQGLILLSTFNGTREDKGRPNRGPQIDIWQRLVIGRVGEPWCAIVIAAMFLSLGVDRKKLPANPASCRSWFDLAVKKGALISSPKRGCLGLWLNRSPKSGWWIGHIFFCAGGLVLGRVRTWEGNTDEAGSREGVKVTSRSRSLQSIKNNKIHAFIDVEKLFK